MKVIEEYSMHDNITCHGKNIFDTTRKYLDRFPAEYSECYKKNIKTLKLLYVDRMLDASLRGYYDSEANKILYVESNSLGHEMFHVASNDLDNSRYAFESKMDIELGLIEGMTEYFAMKAYGLSVPTSYSFEVFCVMMLEDIPNIFRSYFVPNNDDFINLFPKRRDIYSLLYSLDAYSEIESDYLDAIYNGKKISFDNKIIKESIQDTLSGLVTIELSLDSDPKRLNEYGDKFMDNLSSDFVGPVLKDLYPKYLKYANDLIKKKIRKKR